MLNTNPTSSPPHKSESATTWRNVASTLALILLAPAIALFISAFIIQSYQVDGESMEKTLRNNDRLIINKLPRTWAKISGHSFIPTRGDIIIFTQGFRNFADCQT